MSINYHILYAISVCQVSAFTSDMKTWIYNGNMIWIRVFNNGPIKTCWRQPSNYMACLGRPYHFKFFKGCIPQINLVHSWIPWPIYTYSIMNCGQYLIEDHDLTSCFLTFSGGIEWRHSGVFIVYFEHISHLGLVFLLLTLNM